MPSSSLLAAGVSPLPPPEETLLEHGESSSCLACPDDRRARLLAMVTDTLAQSPHLLGFARSRWTLSMLQKHFDFLGGMSPSGVSRWLRRLGVSFQRAREFIRSPDPQYQPKADYLRGQLEQARAQNTPLYFWDAMSIQFDHPGQAKCWAQAGSDTARVERTGGKGGKRRFHAHILGAMNARSGQVQVTYPKKLDRKAIVRMLESLVQKHGEEQVHVVLDNAPIHFHQDVLDQLASQEWPFKFKSAPNWAPPEEAARATGELNVQLLPLPTYSPWLNPIEKLWKMLRERVLHLHPWAQDPSKCKRAVKDFFQALAHGFQGELRSYTGLDSIFPV